MSEDINLVHTINLMTMNLVIKKSIEKKFKKNYILLIYYTQKMRKSSQDFLDQDSD